MHYGIPLDITLCCLAFLFWTIGMISVATWDTYHQWDHPATPGTPEWHRKEKRLSFLAKFMQIWFAGNAAGTVVVVKWETGMNDVIAGLICVTPFLLMIGIALWLAFREVFPSFMDKMYHYYFNRKLGFTIILFTIGVWTGFLLRIL